MKILGFVFGVTVGVIKVMFFLVFVLLFIGGC